MGHDPSKKILFNLVFLVVVARRVSALCGYVQCVSLCVVVCGCVCVVAVVVVMVLYIGDGHDPLSKNSVTLTVVALPARNVPMSL